MLVDGSYTAEHELRRVHLLLAAGMGTRHTALLVNRSRSTICRMTNPAALEKHREYNRNYMRRKRAAKQPSMENNMTDEQITKLVADLKAVFCPFLHRLCDAIERIARG
jgi:IS30 family transposase